MNTTWEQVYIFISSTFDDMHAERDYLVKRVFPQLQDWCEQRKLRLVDVDLRWGITEQAATHNKNTLQICLRRIDDCRPFFLCFLGQRRGWMPQPADASEETLAAYPGLRSALGTASITELEIQHALMNPFHQRTSHDLSEYDEQARYAFFYLRDPSYLAAMPADPPQRRRVYTNEQVQDLAERTEHDQKLAHSRRFVSASPARAHHYVARWSDKDTTPELALPLQCHSSEPHNVNRWHEQWAEAGVNFTGLDVAENAEAARTARAFNSRLCAGRLAGFESEDTSLSDVILFDLQAAIIHRFPHHLEVVNATDLEEELEQQEEFRLRACEGFIEREEDFDALDQYVTGTSDQLFVLTAAGGMGKSTLLANWVEHYCTKSAAGEPLHMRFIGASDGTTTVYSLLRYLLREMHDNTGESPDDIPDDPVKLREKWPQLLETIGKHGKRIIVLDALDQLETSLADLDWLPWGLPPSIKLIVSFKLDAPGGDALYRSLRASRQVILNEVKPFTDVQQRRRLVQAYLSQYLKELDDQHLEVLVRSPGAGNPLYLKVVLSELRVFGAFDQLATKIRADFGDSPISAFHGALKRLETDPAYSPLEPGRVVPLLFGLLAHSRYGLSVTELKRLLLQILGFEATEENQVVAADSIALFLRQLRPFLARRQGRYDFFLESFKSAAQARYAPESPDGRTTYMAKQWHEMLADYFNRLPLWQQSSDENIAVTKRQPVVRRAAELTYHLLHAQAWGQLESTLCDLRFIEAKCAAGMTYDLVLDFENSITTMASQPEIMSQGWTDRVATFAEFVRQEAYNLHKFAAQPGFAYQQAHNYSTSGAICAAWEGSNQDQAVLDARWFKLSNRPSGAKRLTATLGRHRKGATDCAFFPDGKHLISSSMDHTLVIWDTRTWISSQFVGLNGSIDGCDVSPDGTRIVSACDDGYVRLHHSETKETIVCEGTYKQNPRRCRFFPDGQRVLSVGREGGRIHDTRTGQLVRAFGDKETFNDCQIAPDGLIALASSRGGIAVYDVDRNEIIKRRYLPEGDGGAVACAFSPDGRLLLATGGRYYSKGEDEPAYGESMVRNTATWEEIDAHEQEFPLVGLCCTFLLDGAFYVIGLMNGELHIFDSNTGKHAQTIAGHSSTVRGLALSPDGEKLVTASLDNQLKVWNASALVSGEATAEPTGRGLYCVFSNDGERAVALTGVTEQYRCDFYYREYDFSQPVPEYVGARRLERGRSGMDLELNRKDLLMPKTVVDIPATAFGSLPLHRTAPVIGPETHWLIHSSARLFPDEFHLLPTIPQQWQSRENRKWAKSTDGRKYAIVQAGTIVIYDLAERKRLEYRFECNPLKIDVPQCTFSENGHRVYFIVSHDLFVVDLLKEKTWRLFSAAGDLHAFCESPDGERILTAGENGLLASWEAHSGQCLKRYTGHGGDVIDCAYIDNNRFISIGLDRTVRLWHVTEDEELAIFVAETSMAALAISPSKRHVLAMDIQGHAYLLQLC
jgi:WD40 repeat protein